MSDVMCFAAGDYQPKNKPSAAMPAILEPQTPETIDHLRGLRQQRQAFRASIAEQAARLKEKKCGAHQPRDSAPEAVAAQPDPPLPPAPTTCPWFSIDSVIAVKALKVRDIQQAVCDHYGVSMVHLLSDRRLAQLVRARQVAMYLAKELTGKSFPEIGRRFGGRDHTTVLHACRKIGGRVVPNAEAPEMFDPKLAEIVGRLQSELEARL